MKVRKLKKNVVYALYALAFITVIGTIYLLELATNPSRLKDNTKYVEGSIIENNIPVINTSDKIMRPYTASNVSVARNFYEYQETSENQVGSILYYEGTYLPNSGTDYKSEEVFEILSILDGEVTNIIENTLLGKVIEITHENNLISVYQSLSDITVVLNDKVLQGQVIGKSGSANIDANLGNHLHFELIDNGKTVNAENYYDKKLNEL